MRKTILLTAISGLALAACQPGSETATRVQTPSAPAPTNVVDALAPYYAQLDVERPRAPMGRGQPAQDAQVSRIFFGSCHSTERDLGILDQIASENPDLFVYLGDNVYGDAYSWDSTLPELRTAYAELAASSSFRNLREAAPMHAVWDDHDYGMNDFGAEFPFKGFAEELFLEFWNVPEDDARRTRPGTYESYTYGPDGQRVQVILLDTRYFRGPLARSPERGAPGMERYVPTEDTSVTMLGEAQWEWLEGVLAQPADLRLLISSIQVHADGHGWEAWRTMPHERERLYATIEESGAEGVVIISGDRHSSGLYVRDDVISYPLYEMTTSSLNMSFSDENNEPGPHRIGEMYAPVNYGMLGVDWEAGDVALEIRDAAGETVRDVRFSLADLSRN